MSCNRRFSTTKDYLKIEDAQIFMETNKKDLSATSCLDKKVVSVIHDHQKTGLKQENDMSQTICLFRKYLLAKNQHNIGKTNMEESEVIKKKSPPLSPLLIPPKLSSNYCRRPSFLEKQLLPEIRRDATEANSADARSSKSQLTIFYAGTVNVYDNVSIDKAQAILLLAGESSSTKPLVIDIPIAEEKQPLHQSICKPEQDLPIARKISLQHFLEKRRQRIICKSPYLSPNNTKIKNNEAITKNIDGSNQNQSSSLSPFPSRLGYFSPLSTNKFVNG